MIASNDIEGDSSLQVSVEVSQQVSHQNGTDFCINIAILGDTGVGKSSLLYRYSDGVFKSDLIGTAGIDHKQKNIVHMNSSVKMKIWDTAGQIKFRPLAHTYYKKAAGIILVYDVTDHLSFQNMSYWLSKIKSDADPDAKIILLGNKIDLINEIQVNQEAAKQLAAENEIMYFQTSAKDGKNLDQAFQTLIQTVISTEGLRPKITRHHETFKITPKPNSRNSTGKKSKCCQ